MEEEPSGNQADKEFETASLLARNLRVLRNVWGISQQGLAGELALKRNNVASYEAGIVEPHPERLLALARFFRIDPIILLTRDLSVHPLEYLPYQEAGPEEEAMLHLLDTFVAKTIDLQKVLDGFREFYEVKKNQFAGDDATLQSLRHDFENLLQIAENHLETNWAFIHSLHKQ